MLQSWRWFGPDDPVSLSDIRQAGARGIVTALHDLPAGEVWPLEAIEARKNLIEDSEDGDRALHWAVVESVPVHHSIQTGSPERDRHIEAFRQTLGNLAASGVSTVCYNFMPLLDWSRTDLEFILPGGARALRFQWSTLAAFDVHILGRRGAEDDYDDEMLRQASDSYRAMDTAAQDTLATTILAGLPGSARSYTLSEFRAAIDEFRDITAEDLRQNLAYFQSQVVQVAEELGVRLAIHPDDPPFPVLGLPRVVSTREDLDWLFGENDTIANGLTLCTGSFGARPDNDVVDMLRTYADRTHFVHLRNVRREGDGSFHESAHLDGDVDMFEVVRGIVAEEERRRTEGRPDGIIPMRPDHGHRILDDLSRKTNPGYPAIGRLRGLAELRGLETGIRRSMTTSRADVRPSH